MAKIPGLVLRNGTYYFRIRVPLDLVSAFGKREIKETLNTKSFDEAKKRRNERAIHWDARFAEARKQLAQDATTDPVKLLSPECAVKLVQAYVERRDREWRQQYAKLGPVEAEQQRERIIELGIDEQILKDPEDPRRYDDVWQTRRKILEESGFRLGEGSIADPELFELVRRALLELCRRHSAQLKDDYSKPYFDHLFAQASSTGTSAPTTTFGELCEEYFHAYREEAGFKNIDQKRVDKLEATLKLVEEVIGPNAPVVEIDYDACVSFRNTLAQVPTNMRKHYGEMPVSQAIATAKKDKRPTMAYSTQQGYLQALTAVLNLGVKKHLLANVPSADLNPHAEKIPDEDKRIPFTTDQLNAIFSAPLYTGCQDDGTNFAKPGPNVIRRARFWVPLIFLFTGMRPNEICQLYVEDLKVSESGIHYFDVVKNQSDKKLKNPTSRRAFPVHSELMNIGLLDYVSDLKAAGETRLFPELKKDKYGYYSTRLADWFSETFLKTVIQKDDRQSLYSLRHNFRDALRHADAPDWVLQAVGGWKQGKMVSDDYGKKDWPDLLHKWVKKVSYPGLDLSHLYLKDQGKG